MKEISEEEIFIMTLPLSLQEAIADFNNAMITKKDLDCYYCILQSEINCAEQERQITSEEAWKMRGKYLGLSR